jgi:hypothetical protein
MGVMWWLSVTKGAQVCFLAQGGGRDSLLFNINITRSNLTDIRTILLIEHALAIHYAGIHLVLLWYRLGLHPLG